MKKQCSKCGRLLLLTEFYRRSSRPSGYQSECKDCHAAMSRAAAQRRWRTLEIRQRLQAYRKAWAKTDRGRVLLRKSNARYRASPKGQVALRRNAKKYKQSEKGKASARRHEQTVGRRTHRANYRRSPAGRAVARRAIKRYRRTAKGKTYQARINHRRRAREVSAPATLTATEWQSLLEGQNYACAYCGIAFCNRNPATRDHVYPLSMGGGLTVFNVLPACRSCNSSKRATIIGE